MNELFLEDVQIKAVMAPVDMNTAAITGARISLAKAESCAVVFSMGTSTAAIAQFTLMQHNAASAGTSKVLAVSGPYFVKAGSATAFTKVEPTVAASLYDLSTTFAADGGLVVFEISGEELDVNSNFTHFSVDIADSTAAKLISGIYVLTGLKYEPSYDVSI